MLHGKKGFERIVWAFKNVLNHSLTWLFVDTNAPEEAVSADDAPIKKHHPFGHLVKPEVTRMTDVSVPVMPSPGGEIELEYAEELFEWLGLVALDSLRIRASDEVDPFLCRYQIPQPTSEDGMPVDDSSQPSSIVKLRWHGFASAKAVLDVFLTADNAVMKHWMAMSVSGFDGKASTVLGMGGKEYLCWECD